MMKKSTLLLLAVLMISITAIAQNKCRKGDDAPELKSVSPDGKEYALSSLKGKLVLVDFWASWCVPCRRSNPHLVELYKKYGNAKFKDADGFEIYSISLDKKKEMWKKAIEQDELVWKYHVWDEPEGQTRLSDLYNVQYIPATFLIDEEGAIIGKNLHPEDIDYELEKRLKK